MALVTVEKKIQEKGEKIVPSESLGSLLMVAIQELDPIAYIRFASVYKDFDDPKEFMDILRSIEGDQLFTTKENSPSLIQKPML